MNHFLQGLVVGIVFGGIGAFEFFKRKYYRPLKEKVEIILSGNSY